ncbi:MAG: hypothetical protein K6E59_06965 [Bacilli bacterium]|nr:hypothetical protein [Bacilli bacterium]
MDEKEWEEGPTRNSLQKVAMTAIYDALTYESMGLAIDAKDIVSGLCDLPYEECDYFVKAALVTYLRHKDEAIKAFNDKMRGWTFPRLDRVEQAILLLAYLHFYYIEPEVEKGVVIDVAIKQAKTFLKPGDHRFVNAILDNVLIHAAAA